MCIRDSTWGHQLPNQPHYAVAFRDAEYAVFKVEAPVLTPREQAIGAVYRSVLGREPDWFGLTSYDDSGLDVQLIETDLLCSKESESAHPERVPQCAQRLGTQQGRGKDIADLYHTLLGREPDVRGLAWYLTRPMTIPQIQRDMFCSAESQAGFPERVQQCRPTSGP